MPAAGFGVEGEGSTLGLVGTAAVTDLATQWGVPTFRETAAGCSLP